jgi:hypothetical protein
LGFSERLIGISCAENREFVGGKTGFGAAP